MAVGIAVRDDVGITHWAPYSEKGGKSNDTGKAIARELRKVGKPKLLLACEGRMILTLDARYHPPRINQIRRVSTLVSSVTCMTCILRM